jgi:hypothetical protein
MSVITTPHIKNKRRAKLDPVLRQSVIDAAPDTGAAELWESSPFRLLDGGPGADAIIDALFPADSLLCVAKRNNQAATAPREQWRGKLSAMQFIVPSPMSAMRGLTQRGTSSARCLGNTGPRRFLVVEQDIGTPDEQARILLHLAQLAPLALVLSSGGKSLHGWFYCEGASFNQQDAFFDLATKLGADRATWSLCQLVRLPEGRRDNGNRQSVLFFNPEVIR